MQDGNVFLSLAQNLIKRGEDPEMLTMELTQALVTIMREGNPDVDSTIEFIRLRNSYPKQLPLELWEEVDLFLREKLNMDLTVSGIDKTLLEMPVIEVESPTQVYIKFMSNDGAIDDALGDAFAEVCALKRVVLDRTRPRSGYFNGQAFPELLRWWGPEE